MIQLTDSLKKLKVFKENLETIYTISWSLCIFECVCIYVFVSLDHAKQKVQETCDRL